MNDETCALIIFARYPRKGEVKTRLAKGIGDESALNFYSRCAENTFSECKKMKSDKIKLYVFYSNLKDKDLISDWAGSDFEYFPQSGKNLGERMNNAFKEIYSKDIKKAVIIGTDSPDLNFEIINNSFEILNYTDIVIGPTLDGGYYLLGMNKHYDFLFNKIEWSSDRVFKDTMLQVLENDLSYFTLPKLLDVDTEEDLIQWTKSKK